LDVDATEFRIETEFFVGYDKKKIYGHYKTSLFGFLSFF